MRRGRGVAVLAAVCLAAMTAACGEGSGAAPKPGTKRFKSGASSSPGGLELKSTAFKDGEAIPERYSCKGQNQAPPLAWTGVPSGTNSVALIVTDAKGPSGVFVHWIVTGLPNTPKWTLAAGQLPDGAKVEKNSADQAGYTGMCPPAGETHEYTFEVLALRKPVTLPANAKPADKIRTLRTAAWRTGKLTGTFTG